MNIIQVLLVSSACLCLVRGFDNQAELHLGSSDASCNSKWVSEGSTGKEHKHAVLSPPSSSSQGDVESEEAEGLRFQLVQMSTALKKVQMQHRAVQEAAAEQKAEAEAEAEEKAQSQGVQAVIPHILHQSWKTLEVPAQLSALAKSWKDTHPAWMRMVWTDEDNLRLWSNESAELANLFHSFTEPVMGADATRLLYMKNFGGVYADFDVEPCLNLDEVLSKHQLILVRSPVGFVSNYFYASVAAHPFWDFALQQLPQLDERMAIGQKELIEKGQALDWSINDEIMWTAGPRFIDVAISMYAEEYGPSALDGVKIYDFSEWHAKVAIHHWMGSWHCPRGVKECSEEEKFATDITDGVEMGVVPSEACIAALGDRSNSSLVPDNILLSQADVCFVHVGKAGGNSIVRAMKEMREAGWIRDFLQVHHYHDSKADHNDGEFAWVPGPLQQHSLSLHRCAKTDNVLLWLRDPVSRFISAWKFFTGNPYLPEQPQHPYQVDIVRTFLIDQSLNTTDLAEGPASLMQVDLDPLLVKLFSEHNLTDQLQFINLVPHGSDPAYWYLDSCSDLSSIPISFVGRLESMDEDWHRYVKDVLGAPPHELDSVHSTGTKWDETRVLSDFAVRALRKYYAKEFTCIAKLIEANLLSPSYLDAVTSESNSYQY